MTDPRDTMIAELTEALRQCDGRDAVLEEAARIAMEFSDTVGCHAATACLALADQYRALGAEWRNFREHAGGGVQVERRIEVGHVCRRPRPGGEMIGLPSAATGLRLCRIDGKENLTLCEPVQFERGFAAVVLRRAAISGRVDPNGKIENHFVDVLDAKGDIVETVALDRRSYSALKNRWMRCKVVRLEAGRK